MRGLILTIKTDSPDAEIGLWQNNVRAEFYEWHAHKILADTIHIKIKELLTNNGFRWNDIKGVVVFNGPGSFTGLRIGATVANTLAYSLGIPVIGYNGDNWINDGINKLKSGVDNKIVIPKYGSDANITQPKK
jgi:tRNA threonylcarbamoyladenosine biosynthesis protein TsaB